MNILVRRIPKKARKKRLSKSPVSAKAEGDSKHTHQVMHEELSKVNAAIAAALQNATNGEELQALSENLRDCLPIFAQTSMALPDHRYLNLEAAVNERWKEQAEQMHLSDTEQEQRQELLKAVLSLPQQKAAQETAQRLRKTADHWFSEHALDPEKEFVYRVLDRTEEFLCLLHCK